MPSAGRCLVVECLFEGGEGGALGGGADFAVDVGGGVQVGVAEDAGGDVEFGACLAEEGGGCVPEVVGAP